MDCGGATKIFQSVLLSTCFWLRWYCRIGVQMGDVCKGIAIQQSRLEGISTLMS